MNRTFPRTAGQRITALAVQGRRQDAQRLLCAGIAFLQAGRDAGASKDFLSDAGRGLYDELGELIGGMERDLDNEHLVPDGAQVDRSELLALIGAIEGAPFHRPPDVPMAVAAE